MRLRAFLAAVVQVLKEAEVPFMLTGSLAAAFYGMPRATQDVDVVIEADPSRVDRLVDGLLAAGFYVSRDAAHEAFRSSSQFNAIDGETGWKVDLIVRKDRPFSATEFARRTPAAFLGLDLSLTSLEDLILAKLEWSRLGDSALQRRDIAELLNAHWTTIEHAYLRQWIERLGLEEEWQVVNAGRGDLGARGPE